MTWTIDDGTFELGELEAERGGVIHDAKLVWQTHGTINESGSNVVIYPCSFAATHSDLSWLVGPDGLLDPGRWFIVIPDMFAGGLSSGPANTPDYPSVVTIRDNVLAQRRLLREHFGVDRVHAVYGFSMGAMQSYHWAALFPEAVERAIVVCGSARTSAHNRVFLSGLLRTLEAAPEHLGDGRFSGEPVKAVRAFAHIYAGWGLSQDFYREELYRTALGAPDLDAFIRTDWEDRFGAKRAENLYAQALTWYHADISADPRHGGDLRKALAAIRAKVLLLPSETDLYFRVADNAAELPFLANGELRPIPSIWGHRAGNPATIPADYAFLKDAVLEFLDR